MSFKPSKYQQALFDFIENGTGNALVSAVAGSGKSTSLVKCMGIIDRTKMVHFFAFGKDIAEDLKTKVPNTGNISVSTIHSYGYKMLNRNLDVRPEIDDRKYNKLMDNMYIDMKDGSDSLAEAKKRVLPVVHFARVNMIGKWEDALAISSKYDVICTEDDCKLAMAIIRRGMKETATIDMTDMIWLPVALNVGLVKYDFIMIDECQDLSELQRTLVLKSLKKGGRFVAVGDPSQAIFGFTGADIDSFNKFKKIPNTTELPLSVCYRCPKEVIDLAKTLVPQIEPTEAQSLSTERSVYKSSSISDIKSGDLILCRNTLPLVKLGFQYIAAGVKARIAGRDIGKNLISMINNSKAKTFDEMYSKFNEELEKLESDLIRTKGLKKEEVSDDQIYCSLQDKMDAIRVVSEGCSTIKELVGKIDGIFSDSNGEGILLSTVHKAKGLEANNVYILHHDMMPSKNAKMEWGRVQEYNLMYVAYTRAKKKLGFVVDFDAYGKRSQNNVVRKEPSVIKNSTNTDAIWLVNAGDIICEEMEIVDIRSIPTAFGSTNKYTMVGRGDTKVTKLGSMSLCKIVSGNGLKVGSVVKLKAPVKNIGNYQGITEVNLGMLLSVD